MSKCNKCCFVCIVEHFTCINLYESNAKFIIHIPVNCWKGVSKQFFECPAMKKYTGYVA